MWHDDCISGNGILFYANGGILEGTFKGGKLSGLGRSIYGNGDSYIGMWQDGKLHGQGLFYVRQLDGWQLGNFADGTLVHRESSGQGKPVSISS